MRIISKKKLREFWAEHPRSRVSLEAWYRVVKGADWTSFVELRQTFRSADVVGRFVVFDIGGNKYRLIAAVHYDRDRLYVRHILTHAEYDRGTWRNG